ncbi:MAG: GNAT family N-acetyltransferase [Verrucomicrobia bacterium]|nr:GNAT family N-acetyltransferase [Verrucomicrobiota bacterium]
MKASSPFEFKIATEDWEFELVHRLNYKTFVQEIPQHEPREAPRLVDKFHAENTYVLCLSGRDLAGMVAVRGNRPFSLDQKLPNLESYLPPGHTICEIRLLAVEKNFRLGPVFQGLLGFVGEHCKRQGYNMAIISGTTRQQKLYKHIGFVPFGPLVGTPEAMFQPMYLTLEAFDKNTRELFGASV